MINIHMIKEDSNVPESYPLPQGFSFRMFNPDTDRGAWCRATANTDLFKTVKEAEKLFDEEFAPFPDNMRDRTVLLIDDSSDKLIGTISAWYRTINDRDFGMIHWVGIDEAYQGRGLGKSMVNQGVSHLMTKHDIYMLGTQAFRLAAIKRYLSCGFVPWIWKDEDEGEWRRVKESIDHEGLCNWVYGKNERIRKKTR